MAFQKVKVRGLARLAAGLFACWGGLVAPKGFYDLFLGGQPEANLYSPAPWQFVTREQWGRYAAFELVYGLACLGLALYCWRYAAFLPEWRERRSPAA
jgi:hypothetical protein